MKKRGRPSKTSQVNSCNFDVNAIKLIKMKDLKLKFIFALESTAALNDSDVNNIFSKSYLNNIS